MPRSRSTLITTTSLRHRLVVSNKGHTTKIKSEHNKINSHSLLHDAVPLMCTRRTLGRRSTLIIIRSDLWLESLDVSVEASLARQVRPSGQSSSFVCPGPPPDGQLNLCLRASVQLSARHPSQRTTRTGSSISNTRLAIGCRSCCSRQTRARLSANSKRSCASQAHHGPCRRVCPSRVLPAYYRTEYGIPESLLLL
jgi:hypothetical protein